MIITYDNNFLKLIPFADPQWVDEVIAAMGNETIASMLKNTLALKEHPGLCPEHQETVDYLKKRLEDEISARNSDTDTVNKQYRPEIPRTGLFRKDGI